MKFRIAKRQDKYYPQVKKYRWSKWKRIGEHPGGEYGLYGSWAHGHDDYPAAMHVIGKYEKWVESAKDIKYWTVGFRKP